MTSTPPGGSRRRRPVLIPVLVVLALATVGVSAAFGGLEETPKQQPDQLGKGAEVDQGQMITRFEDAVVRPGGNGVGISDKRYLQIIMKVTNESDGTILAQHMDDAILTIRADSETIKQSDPSALTSSPQIVTVSRGHTYGQLHPKVPATVIMALELPANQQAPKNVQIDAGTFEWHEDFFYGTHDWLRAEEQGPPTPEDRQKGKSEHSTPTVIAQVNLPVRVEDA
jgi:hypothetical protein